MVSFDDASHLPTERDFAGSLHGLGTAAHLTAERTCRWLLEQQQPDGFWCGELEGDTILESEYILLLAWLGREKSVVAEKCAAYLVKQQLSGGGWAMYPGGALDINGSVKAYFALKLTGHDPQADYMSRARDAIRAHGGADAVNSFTRFYLALLGQLSYDHCPAVPPELVLLPAWFPVNMYRISAWSRTIFVPLAIMWAHRPARNIEPEQGIRELYLNEPDDWPALRCPGARVARGRCTWEKFFRCIDRGLKWCERLGVQPLRRRALRVAEKWMTDRFVASDGLGAIFPPIIWSVVALKCLGFRDDSAEMRYCHEQLDALMIEDDETIRLQPCKSPVWDTALTLRALAAAGASCENGAMIRATNWLLDKEVSRPGDWAHNVRAAPAGWCFEHHNDFYPDVDDSIMVLMALREQFDEQLDTHIAGRPAARAKLGWLGLRKSQPTADDTLSFVAHLRVASFGAVRQQIRRFDQIAAASQRGLNWVLAMQNRDGGWGAFDKDNNLEFLCHVPFADHNAMIDPSTPDITARVLEMLGQFGFATGDAVVDRAIEFVRQTREPDGSWFGRWGVNHIYGTWQVLVGLRAVGVPPDDPLVTRGAKWLLAHQQETGGWGESADSYADSSRRGQGPVTASQTAWALLGLMSAGLTQHTAVARGIRYLVESQLPDGTWLEPEFTGTGFPRVFYLRYHMYPIYFPLLAIARWQREGG